MNAREVRRLLIVTYHFPPSSAAATYRSLGFARHLPRNGWDVEIVTAPCAAPDPMDPELSSRVPPGTVVEVAPMPPFARTKPARYLFSAGARWLPSALRAVRRRLRRGGIDAVLTSGPPHLLHLAGLFAQARYRLPWIADFRDPWVACAFWKKPASDWAAYFERRIVERASLVVANAPGAREGLAAYYSKHAAKVVCIPNGFDPEAFVPSAAVDGASRRETVLLHAGEIYFGRDPRAVFRSLHALRESDVFRDRPLRLVFLGSAPASLLREVESSDLRGAVTFEGQVPYREALLRMAAADLLLLLDTPGRKIGVPGKLYEYIGAGRPILALAEERSDVSALLEKSGVAHRVISGDDSEAVAKALVELARHRGGGGAARTASLTREAMSRELATHLDRIVGGPSLSDVPGAAAKRAHRR